MVASTPQPPLWLIRNPSSGLWGKSNVRIQFIFSEKTSDEDLFGRRRRRLVMTKKIPISQTQYPRWYVDTRKGT